MKKSITIKDIKKIERKLYLKEKNKKHSLQRKEERKLKTLSFQLEIEEDNYSDLILTSDQNDFKKHYTNLTDDQKDLFWSLQFYTHFDLEQSFEIAENSIRFPIEYYEHDLIDNFQFWKNAWENEYVDEDFADWLGISTDYIEIDKYQFLVARIDVGWTYETRLYVVKKHIRAKYDAYKSRTYGYQLNPKYRWDRPGWLETNFPDELWEEYFYTPLEEDIKYPIIDCLQEY